LWDSFFILLVGCRKECLGVWILCPRSHAFQSVYFPSIVSFSTVWSARIIKAVTINHHLCDLHPQICLYHRPSHRISVQECPDLLHTELKYLHVVILLK